jgi:hypothetical protein
MTNNRNFFRISGNTPNGREVRIIADLNQIASVRNEILDLGAEHVEVENLSLPYTKRHILLIFEELLKEEMVKCKESILRNLGLIKTPPPRA